MAKFDTTKEFREKATQEDYEALKSAYTGTKSTEWEKHSDTYGFSRSSAINLLKEKAMIQHSVGTKKKGKQNVEMPVRKEKLAVKQRTVYMADDTWEMLQLLYAKFDYLNKANVLDGVLHEAFEKYL